MGEAFLPFKRADRAALFQVEQILATTGLHVDSQHSDGRLAYLFLTQNHMPLRVFDLRVK